VRHGRISIQAMLTTHGAYPSGEIVRLDGILMATFDGTGVCTEFREWWGRRTRVGAKP
jgi:hypothetical protein